MNLSRPSEAHCILAEQELLAGSARAAYERLVPLLDWSHGGASETIAFLPWIAWAQLEIGDVDQATAVLSDGQVRAIDQEQNIVLVDILRVRALLAIRKSHWQEALDTLDDALLRARAMPYPYAEAKALYVYGQLHAARGEAEQAREMYQAALAILHQLGERLYAARIERALAKSTHASSGE